jgi:hypothetical protein
MTDQQEVRRDRDARRDWEWQRAWEEATELERRRYKRLDPMDRLYVLCLVPAGEGSPTLGEAVSMADGRFEEFMRRRRDSV